MKERLIELIRQAKKTTKEANCDIHREMLIADFLLANGVIVPPCNVGDMVYEITSGKVLSCTVEKIDISLTDRMSMFIDVSIHYPTYSATETIEMDYFGKTVFLTEAEAEKALREHKEE